MHNLANISYSFIFFQDFLVWKLCSYCVIQSGWSIATPDFEFQVGFKVHFIKSHYQLATQFSSWSSSCWTTIKSCEFPDTLFRYFLQLQIIEIIKMVEIHQKRSHFKVTVNSTILSSMVKSSCINGFWSLCQVLSMVQKSC